MAAAAPRQAGAGGPPFDVARHERDAYLFTAGQPIRLVIGVHNTSARAAAVRLRVEAPKGWGVGGRAVTRITVAANKTVRRRLTLRPPGDAPGLGL